MGLSIQQLINDCEVFGMPVILVHHHGFHLRVVPDDYRPSEFGYRFLVKDQTDDFELKVACEVSALGDVELIAKWRPDNYIVECKQCYDLVQVETGAKLCSFFWPALGPSK